MGEEILIGVKNQFAKDYNCNIEDFNNGNTLVTNKKLIEGRRIYDNEEGILKILIFAGKAVICADECIKEWCIEELSKIPAEWMFTYSAIKKMEAKLSEVGFEVYDIHHYYLPDEKIGNEELIKNIKWYEKEDIKQFEGDDRFDEAFAFDNNYEDILGVAALDEDGNILAMAGASEDSTEMWQIGINVLPEARGMGISKKIVTVLKNEILKRGKIPFYGTVESHIISQRVAVRSGFYPAFAELKTRKKIDR